MVQKLKYYLQDMEPQSTISDISSHNRQVKRYLPQKQKSSYYDCVRLLCFIPSCCV